MALCKGEFSSMDVTAVATTVMEDTEGIGSACAYKISRHIAPHSYFEIVQIFRSWTKMLTSRLM